MHMDGTVSAPVTPRSLCARRAPARTPSGPAALELAGQFDGMTRAAARAVEGARLDPGRLWRRAPAVLLEADVL